MPLIKAGALVADPWVAVEDGDPLPTDGPVIVSLARFTEEREELLGRGEPLGLRLKPAEKPIQVRDDLHRFELIALEFPTFRDGRAYSHARLLRERFGFRGEIRAVGDVLRDQFLFMHRCGIDAFEVKDEHALAAWQAALAEISVYYQAASDGAPDVLSRRHRRNAAYFDSGI
jgi:uncharacterized protein (DUF934 family)